MTICPVPWRDRRGIQPVIGGLGILATTFLGGQLFDGVGRTAPFMMMGLLNFALMAAALYVRSATSAHRTRQCESSSWDSRYDQKTNGESLE